MKIREINYRRILLLTGAISLSIYYVFQWTQMILNSVSRTSLDFVGYYSASRIAQEFGPAHVYDISFQRAMEEKVVGFQLGDEQVLLYQHMPYLLPLLHIFVDENYIASFVRWVFFLITIYGAGFWALSRWFRKYDHPFIYQDIILGAATFFPCFVSLLLGQDTAILFLGVVLLGYGLINEQTWIAGVGLALITVNPQIIILLVIPFIVLRRDIFWRFLVVTLLLGALSVFVLGVEGVRNFVNILFVSAGGQWYGLNVASMPNLNGFMLRNFSFLGYHAAHLIVWAVYLLGIPGLCLLAVRAKKINIHVLSQMILVCVFIVPHLHFHDLTLLLFPLISVYLMKESNPFYNGLQKALHPMIVSLLFLFGLVQKTFIPTLVIFALFIFLFRKNPYELQKQVHFAESL